MVVFLRHINRPTRKCSISNLWALKFVCFDTHFKQQRTLNKSLCGDTLTHFDRTKRGFTHSKLHKSLSVHAQTSANIRMDFFVQIYRLKSTLSQLIWMCWMASRRLFSTDQPFVNGLLTWQPRKNIEIHSTNVSEEWTKNGEKKNDKKRKTNFSGVFHELSVISSITTQKVKY